MNGNKAKNLSELARVLVRFDHIASSIVNANQSTTVVLRTEKGSKTGPRMPLERSELPCTRFLSVRRLTTVVKRQQKGNRAFLLGVTTVLPTATLPLGYPADVRERTISL
jgi:hypothetical protein